MNSGKEKKIYNKHYNAIINKRERKSEREEEKKKVFIKNSTIFGIRKKKYDFKKKYSATTKNLQHISCSVSLCFSWQSYSESFIYYIYCLFFYFFYCYRSLLFLFLCFFFFWFVLAVRFVAFVHFPLRGFFLGWPRFFVLGFGFRVIRAFLRFRGIF